MASDTRAQVSVVIPTRNRARYIVSAVETALAQEDVDVQVIVVDDSSDDATPDVLRELSDDRLSVIRRETRGGLPGARNTGLEAADREWVAFLDDDDLWAPNKLRMQIAAAERADAGFAYAGAVAVDEKLTPLYRWRLPQPTDLLKELLALNVMPAGSSNVIARLSLLRSVGLADERLSHICDWDHWIRLAAATRPACAPEVLTAYRLHAHGQLSDLAEVLDELDVLEAKHRELRERYNVELDRASMKSYVEKRARHAEARASEASASLARRATRRLRTVLRRAPGPPAPDWLRDAARAARRAPRRDASGAARPKRSAPMQP